MNTGRGVLITFEGIEGSGKSTQLDLLAERWRAAGARLLLTREPGGTAVGRELRRLLLRADGAPLDPLTELLLYAADRAQHLSEVVLPALDEGRTVLCDRYLDATLAYQGYGRGLGVESIRALHELEPLDLRPERTIVFDLDPRKALARARDRDRERGATVEEGRFEAERLEFHERVRHGYLELATAEPERFRVIDAEGTIERVADQLDRVLSDLAPGAGA